MIVYKITNLINNKIYIGKDEKNNPKYFGSGLLIKMSIKKYGKENFKKDILEECSSISELNKQEIFWIKELNSISPNGYNLTTGGSGGDTFSNKSDEEKIEINKRRINTRILRFGINFSKNKVVSDEARKKISESLKGKKHPNRKSPTIFTEDHKKRISESNKGRKLTTEQKEKMSIAKTGQVINDDIRLKISESLKGNSNAKGYKHTEEAKLAMGEKHKGKSNKGYTWTDEQKLKLKETRKNKNNEMTIIYLLECANDDQTLYKIGYTRKSVSERIKKLQTGNPHKIKEVANFTSLHGQKIETYLHNIYGHNRLTGEWFNLEITDVTNFISNCERVEKNLDALKDNHFFNK